MLQKVLQIPSCTNVESKSSVTTTGFRHNQLQATIMPKININVDGYNYMYRRVIY